MVSTFIAVLSLAGLERPFYGPRRLLAFDLGQSNPLRGIENLHNFLQSLLGPDVSPRDVFLCGSNRNTDALGQRILL
jgi:hypothetical protein